MENENVNVNLTENTAASAQPQKKNVVGAVLVAVAALLGAALPIVYDRFIANFFFRSGELNEMNNAMGKFNLCGIAVSLLGFAVLVLFALSQKSKIERLIFIFSGILASSVTGIVNSIISGASTIYYVKEMADVIDVNTMNIFVGDLIALILTPILAVVIFLVANKIRKS